MSVESEEIGHTISVSEEELTSIKTLLATKICDVLPGLLEDILPGMIAGILPKMMENIENKTRVQLDARRDAERFMNDNPTKFNECTKERLQVYERYQRCDSLLTLWDECMAEQPPYVPRKFRKDRYHVNDQEELNIITRRGLANFRCEYDILRKRHREFANKVNEQDDMVYAYVESLGISRESKFEISKIWERDTKTDEEKVQKEWVKKIDGMKKAYAKDKVSLQEKNHARFGSSQNITHRRRPSNREVNDDDDDDDGDDEDDVASDAGRDDQESRGDVQSEPLELEEDVDDQHNSSVHGFTDDNVLDISSTIGNSMNLFEDNNDNNNSNTNNVSNVDAHNSDRRNHTVSFNDRIEDDDDFAFSDTTRNTINLLANNFADSVSSHFRDSDLRTIPHDFFQSNARQHYRSHSQPDQDHQQQHLTYNLRRSTYPR